MAEQEDDSETLASHSSEEDSSNKEDIEPPSTSSPSYSGPGPRSVSTNDVLLHTWSVPVIQDIKNDTTLNVNININRTLKRKFVTSVLIVARIILAMIT